MKWIKFEETDKRTHPKKEGRYLCWDVNDSYPRIYAWHEGEWKDEYGTWMEQQMVACYALVNAPPKELLK